MKTYNGPSASIVYVGIFCLEDRLSDCEEALFSFEVDESVVYVV